MNIKYRKATNKDLDDIVRMSLIMHEAEADRDEWKELIDTGLVCVARDHKKVVGYVSVELFDENHHNFPNSAFVSELFVDERYRKQGIGSDLVRMALKVKLPEKYKYFSITHVPEKKHLTEFYEKLGFKKQGVLKSGNIALIKEINNIKKIKDEKTGYR